MAGLYVCIVTDTSPGRRADSDLGRHTVYIQRYLGMVLHRMCICQKPFLRAASFNHETGASCCVLAISLPWQGEIGLAVDAVHLDNCVHEHCLQPSISLSRLHASEHRVSFKAV